MEYQAQDNYKNYRDELIDEFINRINGLNEYMLENSDKELLLLKLSNDYTYNKAVAIVNKKHIALGDAISEAIDDMVANVDWAQIRQEYTDKAAELGVNNG